MSVVLNRPQKLNALTSAMIAAVRDALKTAQQDPEIHVLILRGNGAAFCAGDDVSELAGAAAMPDEQTLVVGTLQDVTRQIMLGPKPVIVVVQGWAVGAAFSWLLNCDLAVCAESAKAFFP
jgi:enoyl-CoA hydratase/carnithine racemase